MSESYHLPARLDRLQWLALLLGVGGLALGLIGLAVGRAAFFNAYLFAWFFWLGIALGGLAFTMLHHLTGGDWGLAIRRECEAAALTLPLLAIFFIPLAFGTEHLFPWGDAKLVAGDPILTKQHVYFNPTWFCIRAAICFGVWCILTWLLCSESMQYERGGDFAVVRKMRKVSAFGLLVFMVTVTLAAVDWVMSREAHFYSSIIGFMVAIGMTLSALCFVTMLLAVLDDESDVLHFLTPNRLNDIGNLMLTLVILWAYMSFAQFLIIWMGNIKTETPWYVDRGLGQSGNGWKYVGALLLIGHFFVPFLLLLTRRVKRHLPFLTALAGFLLFMRLIDVNWLIAPSSPHGAHGRWVSLPLVLGIGGIWFYVFVAMLRRRPLLARPELDPDEAAHAHGAGAMKGGLSGAHGVH
jgi:hypothetical protein